MRLLVFASFASSKGAVRGNLREAVTLVDRETRELVLRMPASDPRHPRLVVVGGDPDGWRARTSRSAATAWVAVEADGRVPIDIHAGGHASGEVQIEIESPLERRWTFSIPEDAPDGCELRVVLSGPGYSGRLVETATGAPANSAMAPEIKPPMGMSSQANPWMPITRPRSSLGKFICMMAWIVVM